MPPNPAPVPAFAPLTPPELPPEPTSPAAPGPVVVLASPLPAALVSLVPAALTLAVPLLPAEAPGAPVPSALVRPLEPLIDPAEPRSVVPAPAPAPFTPRERGTCSDDFPPHPPAAPIDTANATTGDHRMRPE
jgi:hypothetical protein